MDVRFDGILATLGVNGYKALRRDRREHLNCAGEPDGAPIPPKAKAGLLDRVDLVLKLIDKVESARSRRGTPC
jgi:hypothetical protein